MSKLFFLTWISILYVALSMESRHCARTCSTCYNDDSSCSNVTCSDYGKCRGKLIHDQCGCCIVCAKQEGESCAGPHGAEGFCDDGLKCNVSEKKAVAGKVDDVGVCLDIYCFRNCENARQVKVCGSDGKWYNSLCELRRLRCRKHPHLTEVSYEICENNQTLCDTICNNTHYSPVCGTDKKWYHNKCKLRKAACSSKSKIEVASSRAFCSNNPIVTNPCSLVKCNNQGEKCVIVDSHEEKTDQPFAKCQCITVRDDCSRGITVCGSDNKVYKSECHMNAEACATKKKIKAVQWGLECTRSNGSGVPPNPAQTPVPPSSTQTSNPFHDQQIPRR